MPLVYNAMVILICVHLIPIHRSRNSKLNSNPLFDLFLSHWSNCTPFVLCTVCVHNQDISREINDLERWETFPIHHISMQLAHIIATEGF